MKTISAHELAKSLAEEHGRNQPSIASIYWFPSEEEIRFVELDDQVPPLPTDEREIEAFYFTADPEGGIPFPSLVALIRPEEKDRLSPPRDWGGWDRAELIWERKH